MDWKYLLTSFEGRINRKPFWLTAIACGIGYGILFYIISSVFGTFTPTDQPGNYGMQLTTPGWILVGILYIAIIWFGLALQVKRWHDRNKSGWWVLINLVPLIGGIWALVETGFLAGTPGPNRFGEDPLAGK